MNKYYCHLCAISMNLYNPIRTENINLTGSFYQIKKFMKHTIPSNLSGLISIFNNPEYQPYKDYTLNTSASGSVEIDRYGKTNIIWYAGKNTGITYNNGLFLATDDSVKVVLHNDILKIHSFPVDSLNYETKKCLICGRDIIY